ncbi:MAG TPA: nucleoside 2-deoxyribosyltransferase, partial [Methanocorpusculum sp.]|nr:nucleoside 2-deoxyribosyltransferase [Methanocorpusculum sp.]
MYVLVSPCLMNEKFCAEGIPIDSDRSAWASAISRCQQFDIEIISLPCSEMLYLCLPRHPGFFLDRLGGQVQEIIAGCGVPPVAIVGVNSSPTCGGYR